MKVRLEENLQLVITPESYVESVALSTWIEKNRLGLLVEAFNFLIRPCVLKERQTIITIMVFAFIVESQNQRNSYAKNSH